MIRMEWKENLFPNAELYGCILSLAVTNETIMKTMQPVKGFRGTEWEADVVFTTGGVSDPKPGIIPPDEAGLLLEFNTEGGVP